MAKIQLAMIVTGNKFQSKYIYSSLCVCLNIVTSSIRHWFATLKTFRIDHAEDPGTDGRILLERKLRKQGGRCGLDSSG
jgi:hypothetical protein